MFYSPLNWRIHSLQLSTSWQFWLLSIINIPMKSKSWNILGYKLHFLIHVDMWRSSYHICCSSLQTSFFLTIMFRTDIYDAESKWFGGSKDEIIWLHSCNRVCDFPECGMQLQTIKVLKVLSCRFLRITVYLLDPSDRWLTWSLALMISTIHTWNVHSATIDEKIRRPAIFLLHLISLQNKFINSENLQN